MDRKHFENLHVGDWVTAVEVVEYEHPPAMPFGASSDDTPVEYWSRRTVSGMPMQIKAMSYPFMVVHDGQQRHALDSRNVNLVKVSRGYVRQAMQIVEDEPSGGTDDIGLLDPSSGPRCPRCHYPGDPRMIMAVGGKWRLECPKCHLQFPDD